ncbi:MAG: thiamine pyrophosphate-dependent enzyme [Candidatus Thioglobus sp.]|jgi:acetoin:2,6-dichlorophenolindophenol oxidoreductase subunit alpha
MRSPILGKIDGLPDQFGPKFALDLFTRGNFSRQFELEVKEKANEGEIHGPIYLSIGTEFNSAALSLALDKPLIFGQHRGHSLYLSFGGDPEPLRDELLGLKSGCSQGVGGSCCIQCKEINMFGHSGLLGEQVPLAVGACFAKKQLTLAVFGDAAIEEDYIAPALGWAVTNDLPIVFICEDNDLSVLTKTEDRRSWKATDLAKSLDMYAVDITDDPWLIAYHVKKISESGKPGFINIRTVRGIWHAGTGVDNDLEWNRYELVEKELSIMGLSKEMNEININNRERVKLLWQKLQQKL